MSKRRRERSEGRVKGRCHLGQLGLFGWTHRKRRRRRAEEPIGTTGEDIVQIDLLVKASHIIIRKAGRSRALGAPPVNHGLPDSLYAF